MNITQEQLKKWIDDLHGSKPIYQIEREIGMPSNTLRNALNGHSRGLPRKWEIPVLHYFEKDTSIPDIRKPQPKIFVSNPAMFKVLEDERKAIKKTTQQYLNIISQCEFPDEYKAVWAEIEAATHLTQKEKSLLKINMNQSKL